MSATTGIGIVIGIMSFILFAAFIEKRKASKNTQFPINAFLADTAGVTGSLAALLIALLMNQLAEEREIKSEHRELEKFRNDAALALTAELYSQAEFMALVSKSIKNGDSNKSMPKLPESRPAFDTLIPRIMDMEPDVRRAILSTEISNAFFRKLYGRINNMTTEDAIATTEEGMLNTIMYYCLLTTVATNENCDVTAIKKEIFESTDSLIQEVQKEDNILKQVKEG